MLWCGRVGVRIEATTLKFFQRRGREMLWNRLNLQAWNQIRSLRDARSIGPLPSTEPATAQRSPATLT
jgi:hypothetical protein